MGGNTDEENGTSRKGSRLRGVDRRVDMLTPGPCSELSAWAAQCSLPIHRAAAARGTARAPFAGLRAAARSRIAGLHAAARSRIASLHTARACRADPDGPAAEPQLRVAAPVRAAAPVGAAAPV